jgi:hypothetical protein
MGFAAAYELSQLNDIDSLEYSERLKDALIESYICMVHGIAVEDNDNDSAVAVIKDINVLKHLSNVI